MAGHAAHDRHPQDAPRRVVERAESTGSDAGERDVQQQREPRGGRGDVERGTGPSASRPPRTDPERGGDEDADGKPEATDARLHVVVEHVVHAVDEMRSGHDHQRGNDQTETRRRVSSRGESPGRRGRRQPALRRMVARRSAPTVWQAPGGRSARGRRPRPLTAMAPRSARSSHASAEAASPSSPATIRGRGAAPAARRLPGSARFVGSDAAQAQLIDHTRPARRSPRR